MIELFYFVTSSWGRATLYFALTWTLYVTIKAFYEASMTNKNEIQGEVCQQHQYSHKRQHIAILLSIAFVSLFMIFAYVWFDMEDTGLGDDDRSIGIFNVFFINLHWLVIINHFKNERLGNSHIPKVGDIFKF